jgi:hypothetical protein
LSGFRGFVRFERDRELLRAWLKAGRQGQLRSELQILSERADVGPIGLAQAMEAGRERLEDIGLSENQADRLLSERARETRLELEDILLPDRVVIELDVSSSAEPELRSFDDLSPGPAEYGSATPPHARARGPARDGPA